MNLLEIRNLRCSLDMEGRRVEVVRGIDLSIKAGEILGIVGESGSGKTMTMRSVIRILPQNALVEADELSFNGLDLRVQTEKSLEDIRGSEISMIFQDPMTSLNPLKRIGDHITEVLLRHRDITMRAAREEAVALLERVGIPSAGERMRQYPHELSGGMRQRVLIAMALACRPRLLIADEPTTALDVTIQAQLLALIRTLQQKDNMAVALITHDLGVIAGVCHRVAVMYAGLLMETGDVETLFEQPLHPYTRALLRSVPVISQDRDSRSRLRAINGQPPSVLRPPPGCPFAPRCSETRPECSQSLPSMKEYAQDHCARCFNIPGGGL
ncbi:dipeptide transport ATP-binding protein DppD [Treponema primitia ZAS-2]|uniref:Dipeptide transport ATP-binding protein DppD n=1 Tax=Treponema primitia (strain ATCC BAA-887 / DSM 12427 / ZAS-2) TaxID=545694 RepID=F5YJ66_TREPZ|nr:ABC transporter ATP-binding protein [Treponema primitia]AEF85379.1 dipeptide transport ATP-binding protein DppD [Treponema primitia ZAS-2]